MSLTSTRSRLRSSDRDARHAGELTPPEAKFRGRGSPAQYNAALHACDRPLLVIGYAPFAGAETMNKIIKMIVVAAVLAACAPTAYAQQAEPQKQTLRQKI